MDPQVQVADKDLDEKLKEHFKTLPKVVQDAITSADVEKRMRELADTQKLHLDQWTSLENEVMMTLLGFQPIEDLEKNIKSEVKVSDEVAKILTAEISKIVFEPIRGELERQLDHPKAKAAEVSDVEQVRRQEMRTANSEQRTEVQPATPPAAANEQKVERAPVSETYKPGEASNERKTVHDDPYRETP